MEGGSQEGSDKKPIILSTDDRCFMCRKADSKSCSILPVQMLRNYLKLDLKKVFKLETEGEWNVRDVELLVTSCEECEKLAGEFRASCSGFRYYKNRLEKSVRNMWKKINKSDKDKDVMEDYQKLVEGYDGSFDFDMADKLRDEMKQKLEIVRDLGVVPVKPEEIPIVIVASPSSSPQNAESLSVAVPSPVKIKITKKVENRKSTPSEAITDAEQTKTDDVVEINRERNEQRSLQLFRAVVLKNRSLNSDDFPLLVEEPDSDDENETEKNRAIAKRKKLEKSPSKIKQPLSIVNCAPARTAADNAESCDGDGIIGSKVDKEKSKLKPTVTLKIPTVASASSVTHGVAESEEEVQVLRPPPNPVIKLVKRSNLSSVSSTDVEHKEEQSDIDDDDDSDSDQKFNPQNSKRGGKLTPGRKVLKCAHCELTFNNVTNLRHHKLTNHQFSYYKKCRDPRISHKKFEKVVEEFFDEVNKKSIKLDNLTKHSKCRLCEEHVTFATRQKARFHITKQHRKQLVPKLERFQNEYLAKKEKKQLRAQIQGDLRKDEDSNENQVLAGESGDPHAGHQ